MPPRLPRPASGLLRRSRLARNSVSRTNSEVCLLCRFLNLSSRRAPSIAPSPKFSTLQARHYTEASSAAPIASHAWAGGSHGRNYKLQDVLTALQKTAGSYVDVSKLQLALRGLQQGAGNEIIRVAVMGIGGKQDSLATVKKLLRLVLADPLKEEQEWERTLLNESQEKPVLLRFGSFESGPEGTRTRNNLIRNVYVHSPALTGHQLEILVLETSSQPENDLESDILVPTIKILTSSTGRHTSVTTPVHKSLIIGDGLLDAATIIRFSETYEPGLVGGALNLPGYKPEERPDVSFPIIDIREGQAALSSLRQSVENAITYEHQWFRSGLPAILEWLKSGTAYTEGTIKPSVLNLINSIVSETALKIQEQRTTRSAELMNSEVPWPVLQSLRMGLEKWAERAHTELRDDLDIAFQGRRWRKLSWYKLFWRVDDVSYISSEMLSQRFLTSAEKEIIHLAGKIDQAGVHSQGLSRPAYNKNWAFTRPIEDIPAPQTLGGTPPPTKLSDLVEKVNEDKDADIRAMQPRPWPMHIPATRTYLIHETVPALQALSQKLVFETLGTSAISTALAGLIYFSSMTSGIYEVGGIAALGIVWSLRRMQGKWETARSFWEGEVREEGRRAIRGVEGAVSDVLVERDGEEIEGEEELKKAEEAVERVEEVLEEMENEE